MRKNLITRIAAGIAIALCSTSVAQAEAPEGQWTGVINIPGGELGIEVTLERVPSGGWTGDISIPIQGLRDYELSDVTVSGDAVSFAMEGIPGRPSFVGEYDPGESAIEGSFTQGPQKLSFSLHYSGDSADSATPPLVPRKGISGSGVVGEWIGALSIGPAQLRIALHVDGDESGSLTGSIDSLDQGAMGIGIDRISFTEGELRFEIDQINSSFEGALNDDGSALIGTWTQFGNPAPLTFLRIEEPVTLSRPQEPHPPFPYEAREVSFRNADAGLSLSGTFVIPEGEGPFPAVVFVSGSGPQDRDESLMGHRPFAVLADYFARRGIASLRFDDRGVGESEGEHLESTVSEFAGDAIAAAEFLSQQEEIDEASVGIIGHSEGGLIGPMAAYRSQDVDFLVLLAPPAEPLDALLSRQFADISRLSGVSEALIQRGVLAQKSELALIKDASLNRAELKKALWESWQEQKAELTEEEMRQLQLSDARVRQAMNMVTTKWFRSLMRLDPRDYLAALGIPVLALFGEKDVQVAAETNARIVREVFETNNHSDYRVVVREGLNHLFQNSATGAIEEYARIEETFDAPTMQMVAEWILERFGK